VIGGCFIAGDVFALAVIYEVGTVPRA